MRQMEPHVKWHFFGWKVIFSISDFPERFKTCSDLLNMGRLFSVSMPVGSDPSKFCDD